MGSSAGLYWPGVKRLHEGRDQSHLMGTIDQLNRRFGKRTVFVGSAGIPQAHEWAMRQERRTPQYTTRLADIPVARA